MDKHQIFSPVLDCYSRYYQIVCISSVEETVFLWCNANVLRLNEPLVLVIKIKGMVSPQLAWRVGLNYAIYY